MMPVCRRNSLLLLVLFVGFVETKEKQRIPPDLSFNSETVLLRFHGIQYQQRERLLAKKTQRPEVCQNQTLFPLLKLNTDRLRGLFFKKCFIQERYREPEGFWGVFFFSVAQFSYQRGNCFSGSPGKQSHKIFTVLQTQSREALHNGVHCIAEAGPSASLLLSPPPSRCR